MAIIMGSGLFFTYFWGSGVCLAWKGFSFLVLRWHLGVRLQFGFLGANATTEKTVSRLSRLVPNNWTS